MGLSLDAFTAASQPKRATCSVRKVLDDLPPMDAKVLAGALADDSITHAAIEKVLVGEGIKINQGTIARHRRGGCACA